MQKPDLLSYTLLFILAAIWGSAFFNYKIVLKSFDIFTLAGGRVFFGSILTVIIALYFNSVKFKNFFSKGFYLFFFIGLTNYAIPFVFIAIGIEKMSSGLAALLMSTGPFYAITLSHFLTEDKFNNYKFIGTCLGFFSVGILVYDQIYITETTNFLSIFFVMIASLSYIIGGLIIKKNIKNYNNETISCFSMIWGTLILTPFVLYFYDKSSEKIFEADSLYSLIYLGLVPTALAFYIRSEIIKKNGLVFMSQVSLLLPIFGVFFSYLFLNELIYKSMFISLFFLFIGLVVLQLGYKTNY